MIPASAPAIVRYSIVPCALGRLLVAATERGVCAVFLGDNEKQLSPHLESEFPDASITRDDRGLRTWTAEIVRQLDGVRPDADVPIDVCGTVFQRRVWQELCKIPRGQTCSYRDIAMAIGQPESARAVARACATNPASIVIPCHRVVRVDGGLSGYRWGVQRKKAILEQEKRPHSA